MPRSDKVTAEGLLNTLLDRHESGRERSRDVTLRIDYRLVGGPAAQDELHRALRQAEAVGAIRLERERVGRVTEEYARIRLVSPALLYDFLARQPALSVADKAKQVIQTEISAILKEPFFRAVAEEAVAAWSLNKRFLGMTVTEADRLVTVVRLTHGVVHLTGPDIDHRTFSRRIVKDSKALELFEGRVALLLKRWNGSIEGEEPREILEECGVVRRAHPLFVKGPLSISSNEMTLQGSGEPYIGIPLSTVQESVLSRPVDYIITIENSTSFWRHCAEVRGSYLALLTNGYPARDVLTGIKHLVAAAHATETPPIFHWGDVDAGGARIAAHLEDALRIPISLHQMSPELALRFGSPLKSRSGLARLVGRESDIGRLASWLMTAEAMALEQEELDPCPP